MITIAETGQFQKKVPQLLSESEKKDLISYLSDNPNAGDLIQGTGGVRNFVGLGVAWEKVVVSELFTIIIVK